MEWIREAPEDEREDPPDDHGEEGRDRPQCEPDEVRDREKEPEEDRESRPLEVVVHHDPNRVLRKLGVRLCERRVRRRVARREKEEVRPGLRGVAERERDQVAKPTGRISARDDREPREERRSRRDAAHRRCVEPEGLLVSARRRRRRALAGRTGREAAAEHCREEECRDCKEQPEEASPPSLAHGRVDLDVDGIVLLNAEPRIRVRREEHVRADLRRVADVARDEVMEAVRHLRLDQHGEPVHEADDERRDAAQHDPEEEGDREEEPEEHRQAAALEVVAHDEPDGALLQRSTRDHCDCRS